MKITQLIQARRIIEVCGKDRISPKLAHKMMRFLKGTDSDNEFYIERMQSIISECAVKDGDGNPVADGTNIKINPQFRSKCEEDMKALADIDVDVPQIKFTLDELEENLKLSADDFMAIDDFIEA